MRWPALLLSVIVIWALRHWNLLANFQTTKPLQEIAGTASPSRRLKPAFEPDPEVPSEVLKLWQSNQPRAALSYLYRSSLAYLTKVHNLVIEDHYTEHDCLVLVHQHADTGVHRYFRQVTNAWSALAYGNLIVPIEKVSELCADWPQLAEQSTTATPAQTVSNASTGQITGQNTGQNTGHRTKNNTEDTSDES